MQGDWLLSILPTGLLFTKQSLFCRNKHACLLRNSGWLIPIYSSIWQLEKLFWVCFYCAKNQSRDFPFPKTAAKTGYQYQSSSATMFEQWVYRWAVTACSPVIKSSTLTIEWSINNAIAMPTVLGALEQRHRMDPITPNNVIDDHLNQKLLCQYLLGTRLVSTTATCVILFHSNNARQTEQLALMSRASIFHQITSQHTTLALREVALTDWQHSWTARMAQAFLVVWDFEVSFAAELCTGRLHVYKFTYRVQI